MTIHEFKLPCYCRIERKTKPPKIISLNLNWYRNAFHYDLNNIKQAYAPLEGPEGFKAACVKVSYLLILASGARTDVMNWVSVADKFFSDWLVGKEYIKDDSFKYMGAGGWDYKIDRSASENYIIATVIAYEEGESA